MRSAWPCTDQSSRIQSEFVEIFCVRGSCKTPLPQCPAAPIGTVHILIFLLTILLDFPTLGIWSHQNRNRGMRICASCADATSRVIKLVSMVAAGFSGGS